MKIQTTILGLLALTVQAKGQTVTGKLGNAVRNNDDPAGAAYIAELGPGTPMGIRGSVLAISAGDQGTEFAVNLENLPLEGGPFCKLILDVETTELVLTMLVVYHIHVMPVPSDGNCTGTLGHLDPFVRGETPGCQEDRPDTCQVGDLAGKHGTITGKQFNAS
jgi:hypothetical protein